MKLTLTALTTSIATALLVPLLAAPPAQSATTWSVPGGISVELSSGAVSAFAQGAGSTVYVAGSFMTDGRDPQLFNVSAWNGRKLTPLPFVQGAISSLAYDRRSQVLYAGGLFTRGSTLYGVMKWDGLTWTPMADLGDYGGVDTMAIAPDGTLYIGGTFIKVDGVPYAGNIARYSPSTGWSSIGVFNDQVNTLAVDNSGRVYAGGLFTRISSTTVLGSVAMWDGSAWTALGATNGHFTSLVVGPGNVLYGRGTFTEIDGITAQIVKIRPLVDSTWKPVSTSQLTIPPYAGSRLAVSPRGELMVAVDGRIHVLSSGRWKAVPGVFEGPVSVLHMDSSGGLLAGGAFVSVDRKRIPGLAYRSGQTAPPAPRTVTAEAMSREILVQWSAVNSTPRVTRYEAECTRTGGGATVKRAVTGRFAPLEVDRAGTYRCRVRAQNSVGWGPWSAAVEVRVR